MHINAIGSVLIYNSVYGYSWAGLFRGSIILATVMRKIKKKSKHFVLVCDNKKSTRVKVKASQLS